MTLGSPLRFGASTSLSIEDPSLTRLSGPMSVTTSAPTVNNSITRSIVLDKPGRHEWEVMRGRIQDIWQVPFPPGGCGEHGQTLHSRGSARG